MMSLLLEAVVAAMDERHRQGTVQGSTTSLQSIQGRAAYRHHHPARTSQLQTSPWFQVMGIRDIDRKDQPKGI
jgi:hypothetical protein